MRIAALALTQRDGTTCGPSVAVMAGALLDPVYGASLARPQGRAWFAAEQARVHDVTNRIWPRALGTTPAGMAAAISVHSAPRGRRYRWRPWRGRRDRLADVLAAVPAGWPVAMLVGGVIPRHWVLIVEATGDASVFDSLACYEPSSGEVRTVGVDAVRRARLTGLGYPRPFAFVVPGPLL
ncbi:hypothetical protein ASG82_11140 [Mycobacterium sp. Soil538]|nr:hypothetical protein ASG82_11140 [Mycobacterium sp. Soil538]